MRARNTVAATLICLSLAGCFTAGRKAPLVDNRPDAKLVERYNEDVSRRLNGYQQELHILMDRASAAKYELKRYKAFERGYRKSLEAKCEGAHDNDLVALHGEVVEWRTRILGETDKLSSDFTDLITSLATEKLAIETTEREVGWPVFTADNKGIVITIMDLAMRLRGDFADDAVDPLPAPDCDGIVADWADQVELGPRLKSKAVATGEGLSAAELYCFSDEDCAGQQKQPDLDHVPPQKDRPGKKGQGGGEIQCGEASSQAKDEKDGDERAPESDKPVERDILEDRI